MKSISKAEIMALAKQLHFSLSDAELASLEQDFEVYFKQLEVYDLIDTDDVSPMVYPFEAASDLLRDDQGQHILDKEAILSNAPQREGDFVVVPKVVK